MGYASAALVFLRAVTFGTFWVTFSDEDFAEASHVVVVTVTYHGFILTGVFDTADAAFWARGCAS